MPFMPQHFYAVYALLQFYAVYALKHYIIEVLTTFYVARYDERVGCYVTVVDQLEGYSEYTSTVESNTIFG